MRKGGEGGGREEERQRQGSGGGERESDRWWKEKCRKRIECHSAGGWLSKGRRGDQRRTGPVKQIITSPLCNLLQYLASSPSVPLDTSSRTSLEDLTVPNCSFKLVGPAKAVQTFWNSEVLSRMRWLDTVRSLFKGGSRSAPVTPTSSPCIPSKKDHSAKQVRD